MPVSFDTLEYARRLRQIGFDERQAEGMTEALASAMTESLATKQDLRDLELRLTLRLGAIVLAGIGIVSALVKVL